LGRAGCTTRAHARARHSYNAPQPHCTLHSSNSGLHFGREVASPIGGHRRASCARDRLCSDVIGRGGARPRDEHACGTEVAGTEGENTGQRCGEIKGGTKAPPSPVWRPEKSRATLHTYDIDNGPHSNTLKAFPPHPHTTTNGAHPSFHTARDCTSAPRPFAIHPKFPPACAPRLPSRPKPTYPPIPTPNQWL